MRITTKALGLMAICVSAAMAQNTSRGPLLIDLRAGQVIDLGPTAPVRSTATSYVTPYATVQLAADRSCPETPFQARVDINLAPGNGTPEARRVRMTVEYEGASTREPKLPTGWVTHIGDDAQNDGFGGGTGIDGVAEMHILDQDLSVYSAATGPGVVDRIAFQELSLAKGALHFDVAAQYLSWGQPLNELNTQFGQKLFRLTGADRRIFAGFNRVIRNGSTRKGCGARRVLIEFVP